MMAGQFQIQLAEFAKRVGDKADALVGGVIVRVAAELDFRSPVGDATYWKHPAPKGYVGGHFRANWQLGVNYRPTGEIARTDRSAKDRENGGNTTRMIVAVIPEDSAGPTYWLANNVPYARRLEDKWSRQAPQGMVGLTVTMFQTIVRDAVEALPK